MTGHRSGLDRRWSELGPAARQIATAGMVAAGSGVVLLIVGEVFWGVVIGAAGGALCVLAASWSTSTDGPARARALTTTAELVPVAPSSLEVAPPVAVVARPESPRYLGPVLPDGPLPDPDPAVIWLHYELARLGWTAHDPSGKLAADLATIARTRDPRMVGQLLGLPAALVDSSRALTGRMS